MDVGVNSNDPFWWNPVSHAGGRQCVRPSQERETSVNSDRGGGDDGDEGEGDGKWRFLTHQVLSVRGPEFASSYRLLRTR